MILLLKPIAIATILSTDLLYNNKLTLYDHLMKLAKHLTPVKY